MIDKTPKLTRSEQSRINGAKSHGPTSIDGKAISSRNALKHGFAAAINNVIAVEDKDVFEHHVASYRDAFTPQNYFEETLIDQLASINWRQTRLAALETALLDAQLTVQADAVTATEPDGEVDPYARFLYAWHALARTSPMPQNHTVLAKTFDIHCLELIRRYITTLDRQYRNTILNLRQYRKDFAPLKSLPDQKEPENLPPPAPVTVVEAVETPMGGAPKSVVRPIAPIGPTLVGSKEITTTGNRVEKNAVETKNRT